MCDKTIEIKGVFKPSRRVWLTLTKNQFRLGPHYYKLKNGYRDGSNSIKQDYDVQMVAGRFLLYQNEGVGRHLLAWSFSPFLLVGNIVHNISVKCFWTLLVCALTFTFNLQKGYHVEKSQRMWRSGAPYKALAATILGVILHTVSFLSFGLISNRLNRKVGMLEMWTVGDTLDDVDHHSLPRRCKRKYYFAPCQQPLCVLKDDAMTKAQYLSNDPVSIKVKNAIKRHRLRTFLPRFITHNKVGKSLHPRDCNF